MSEIKAKWHPYPKEKPTNDTCKYIVIYNWDGESKAMDCGWIKGRFTGIKNDIVEAWTEMPYAMLRGIYE